MNLELAFHSFDIRGDYPQVVDEELAFLVGRRVTEFLRAQNLLVASDNRPSSPSLRSALIAGITAGGAAVTNLGELPIPVFYHAVHRGRSRGGVMITASHIHHDQNGFKIVREKALPLNEGEILKIREMIGSRRESTDRKTFTGRKTDAAGRQAASQNYTAEITSRFQNLTHPGKIIFDSGQTLLTLLLQKILPSLKLDYEILTAPRDLNPLREETRRQLSRRVAAGKAALGVIFDGDGDRVLFLDRRGRLIPPTFILGLIARNYKKAVFDMRAGVAAYTTRKTIVPSWAQNLKFAMREDPEIEFGGETSGHLVFREWFSIDDGLFGALKFLQLTAQLDLDKELSGLGKNFAELPEENFPKSENYPLVLGKIADEFRQKGESVSILDGVTVCGGDYKFNLRPSLTEPFLRLNLEAQSREQLQKIRREVIRLLPNGGS